METWEGKDHMNNIKDKPKEGGRTAIQQARSRKMNDGVEEAGDVDGWTTGTA